MIVSLFLTFAKIGLFTFGGGYAMISLIESICVEQKGMLAKIKPYGFTLFVQRYGEAELLDCLERNEKSGIVYHREGIIGDYDDFDDVEELIRFIKTGSPLS